MKIFLKKFPKIINVIFMIFVCCCSNKDDSVNNLFVKKFGEQVKEINSKRVLPKSIANEVMSSTPPSKEEISDYIASQEKYQGYVPIYNVGEYVPKQYYPDRSTINELSKNNPANSVPPDIFEVSYNTQNNPPFKYTGAEFDMIKIPSSDRFGNSSAISEKKYLLIANNDIQSAVDKINSSRSEDDFEFSKILVNEKKQQIQKKKNQQIAENSEFSDIALIENYGDNEIRNDSKTINKNITQENIKENKSLANK